MTVAILLAVYEPRMDWFRELLASLNEQTYQDLHLYVRNDCSPKTSRETIEGVLKQCITAFPYTYLENEVNLGSNKTFEALVKDASEEFICFCDQDDIWLPEKVENTLRLYQTSPLHPTLVCTDVKIINGFGEEIAPDMEHHRKRHVFLRGEGLASALIYRNFVMGCTVLMKRETALSYLPFPQAVVHDHYLAFRAALDGALDYLAEPQMLYRVYGGNQTGVMCGVKTKRDYYEKRIVLFRRRLEAFEAGRNLPEYWKAAEWCTAREDNYRLERGSFRRLWKLRKLNLSTSLFELICFRTSNLLFTLAIRLVQKRIL